MVAEYIAMQSGMFFYRFPEMYFFYDCIPENYYASGIILVCVRFHVKL
jgi:hypothetical protein